VTAAHHQPAAWFRTSPPQPSLQHVLACTWAARPTGRHRLVPDACLDLLWLSTGEVWLCGPEATAWHFQLPAGVTAVGARFRPGAFPALTGRSAHSLLERRVRWSTMVGTAAEQLLSHQLAASRADGAAVIQAHLAATFPTASSTMPDPFAETVLAQVTHQPRVRAATVAAACGLTTRHLHRRCLTSFGYGWATLARIVRFHRFWSVAHSLTGASLAELAHRAGYCDQAHLTRECVTITGATPTRFLASSFATFPDMSDPYKTGHTLAATLVP
jgi:AraC-like DNA-binding protein